MLPKVQFSYLHKHLDIFEIQEVWVGWQIKTYGTPLHFCSQKQKYYRAFQMTLDKYVHNLKQVSAGWELNILDGLVGRG